MWKTINRVLEKNVKSTTLSYIENNGQTLTKECDMLETLNHHFVSVGLNLAKQIDVKPEDDCLKHIAPVRDTMKFKAIDEGYVLNAISRLEKGKASGPDKVSVALVVVVVVVYFILSRLLYLAFSANLGLLCMPHPGMGPLV